MKCRTHGQTVDYGRIEELIFDVEQYDSAIVRATAAQD